jgi:hypothetical protein
VDYFTQEIKAHIAQAQSAVLRVDLEDPHAVKILASIRKRLDRALPQANTRDRTRQYGDYDVVKLIEPVADQIREAIRIAKGK